MAYRHTPLRTVPEESHGSGSTAGGGSNNRQSKSKSLVEELSALKIKNQPETRRQANIPSDRLMTLGEDKRRKCKYNSSRPTCLATASGSAESSEKSARSAVDSMSTRTKIALDKIEHLERENERLKRVDASRKKELRNLAIKKDRAASLESRVKEINYAIQQGQRLDVAFLLDITMSMEPSMEMVRNEIVAMASGISDSYPHCKLRFGEVLRSNPTSIRCDLRTVAQFMAEHFNQSTEHLRGVMKVQFTSVSLLEVGDRYFTMEKFLEGEWIRFSNNCDYVNMKDYAATLQAFTHRTYHISRGLLMVTDLQGVKQPDKERPGQHIFCLCDPAIHTSDENLMRFAQTNLGSSGFRLFLDSHKCNDVCLHLGLSAGGAGRIYRGTKVL